MRGFRVTLVTNVSRDFQCLILFLRDTVSKLQDTNERIQEISRYICGVAEGLAMDKQALYYLIHRIAHEMGLVQSECGICEWDNHPSASIDPEPGKTMPNCKFRVK